MSFNLKITFFVSHRREKEWFSYNQVESFIILFFLLLQSRLQWSEENHVCKTCEPDSLVSYSSMGFPKTRDFSKKDMRVTRKNYVSKWNICQNCYRDFFCLQLKNHCFSFHFHLGSTNDWRFWANDSCAKLARMNITSVFHQKIKFLYDFQNFFINKNAQNT